MKIITYLGIFISTVEFLSFFFVDRLVVFGQTGLYFLTEAKINQETEEAKRGVCSLVWQLPGILKPTQTGLRLKQFIHLISLLLFFRGRTTLCS